LLSDLLGLEQAFKEELGQANTTIASKLHGIGLKLQKNRIHRCAAIRFGAKCAVSTDADAAPAVVHFQS
jgi:hypothetical protein